MSLLDIDFKLVDAVITATNGGLEMADVQCNPVSVSKYLLAPRDVSVMVGLVGEQIGNVTLNVSPRAATFMASQLLGEEYTELNEDVLDACGEITNILAGGMMAGLTDLGYHFRTLSCPSAVVGASYSLFHFRGAQTVSVGFEIPSISIGFSADRLFSVVVAFLQK